MSKKKTLKDFGYNGYEALKHVLELSYGSVSQAVASLTLFSHPSTVAQTNNKALFRIIRDMQKRGDILPDKQVVLCDNSSPQNAILWAHSMKYGQLKDVQYNHVYSMSNNVEYYTSLANICITPAYLAKLTDTNEEIKALLKYRVFDIYNFLPQDTARPLKPTDYDNLIWADYFPEVKNLSEVLKKRMVKCAKSRINISAEKFGWLFSDLDTNAPNRFPAPI